VERARKRVRRRRHVPAPIEPPQPLAPFDIDGQLPGDVGFVVYDGGDPTLFTTPYAIFNFGAP
jgi:hypothetical protein